MKVHIFRWATPDQVDIGDVVLWENDEPIQIESITRTKDGYDLTGHNIRKPSNRAVVIRPRGEKVRVAPTREQETGLINTLKSTLERLDEGAWTMNVVDEFTPIIIHGTNVGSAKTVSTGKVSDTAKEPADAQSTPTDAAVS